MKKLMLILLIAGNVWADDNDVYSWGIPDYGKNAERAAQIRKDNAIADYLNRQPSQYSYPAYEPPSQIAPIYGQPIQQNPQVNQRLVDVINGKEKAW